MIIYLSSPVKKSVAHNVTCPYSLTEKMLNEATISIFTFFTKLLNELTFINK